MSFKSKGAVSALYVLFFAACALAQARDTLVISGTVKDSSGAAVANAIVTVGGGFGVGARDTTNASGAYSITYVPGFYTPTSVTVTATAGTRTGTATVTVPAGSSGRIPLTANITIRGGGITPTGGDTLVISGTVKDSSGAAVANAIVTVGGGFGGGTRDTTNASGAYSITYVPGFYTPTTVTVTATAGTRMGTATVTVPASSSGRIPLTANIILGRFINGVARGLAPKAVLTRAYTPSYGYSIDGRRIVTASAGVRANGIRVFRVEGSQKMLTIK